jgi:hypothetical protein
VGEVFFDCTDGDKQTLSDLRVGVSGCGELQNFEFAGAEGFDKGLGGNNPDLEL